MTRERKEDEAEGGIAMMSGERCTGEEGMTGRKLLF